MRRLDGKERVDGVMALRRVEEGVFARRRGGAEKKIAADNVGLVPSSDYSKRLRRGACRRPQARSNISPLLLRASAPPREQNSFFGATK
jgi:hypothetical protein